LRWLHQNGGASFNPDVDNDAKSIYEIRRLRLRQIIDDKFDGSTSALSKAMGWETPSFASRLVSDSPGNQKNIGSRMARSIEQAAGVPEYVLDTPPEPTPKVAAAKRIRSRVEEPVGSYELIPHYNVRGGLGNPQINEHHIEIESDVPLPSALIRQRGWRIEGLKAMWGHGDSMAPRIQHGDPLIVNTDSKVVIGGRVYAFVDADGGISIKRLHRERDGRLRITSDNPDKLAYPDAWVQPSEITIIGEVVHRSGAV
jgi:hypothetical protein